MHVALVSLAHARATALQICAALGRDGKDLYQHQMAAVNPDASILKAPFNDDARASVGLPQSWYDTGLWPHKHKARLLQQPYLDGPCYEVTDVVSLSTQELDAVRSRLLQVCDIEATMAS